MYLRGSGDFSVWPRPAKADMSMPGPGGPGGPGGPAFPGAPCRWEKWGSDKEAMYSKKTRQRKERKQSMQGQHTAGPASPERPRGPGGPMGPACPFNPSLPAGPVGPGGPYSKKISLWKSHLIMLFYQYFKICSVFSRYSSLKQSEIRFPVLHALWKNWCSKFASSGLCSVFHSAPERLTDAWRLFERWHFPSSLLIVPSASLISSRYWSLFLISAGVVRRNPSPPPSVCLFSLAESNYKMPRLPILSRRWVIKNEAFSVPVSRQVTGELQRD